MFAAKDLTVTHDPTWPFSAETVGLPALVLVALVLAGMTIWTYLGVPGATPRRVLAVLGLRLLALLLACLAVLRPSLAFRDELRPPSLLILAADGSESMSIQDEFDGQSRWDYLRRTLEKCEPQLRRLREEGNVTVALYRFDGELGELDLEGKPDGKRTDFGELLHAAFERHRGERLVRGFLILSDGADNGSRYPALSLAGQWRNLPGPIHTVSFGNPTTSERQSDITLVGIYPEPSPVPVKGELTVKVTVDAPGFENAPVDLHLLIDDKEVPVEQIIVNDQKVTATQKGRLTLTAGNEVRLKCSAPPTPGEVKVTVKLDPLAGEVSTANNEISTYLTVAKEGLSVLLVDKPRFPEPQLISDALMLDPRIRLHVAWLRGGETPTLEQADLFQFGKRHYDVLMIGDVTAKQLSAGDPKALATINRMVSEKGTGLLMMGGYATFGNSDWRGTEIDKLLPVKLDAHGQIEGPVKIVPTDAGLRHYLLNLADRRDTNARLWEEMPELTGMTRLGEPRTGATEYARSGTGEPLLVGHEYGSGRVLAFGGDTTHRWIRSPEGAASHRRFWRQVVFWLARQEESKGNLVIKPDARRLAAGGRLGFEVDLRGKGDTEPKEKHFEVQVINPRDAELPVATVRDQNTERGTFWKTDVPGEYRLVVRGWGVEADGSEIPAETATARFLVYQDDAEMVRRAADHDFLKKLAASGGGRFHRPEELARFLHDLLERPLAQGRPRAELWPEWRTSTLSGFLVGFFLLFVALLGLEWFLRRRWGLV